MGKIKSWRGSREWKWYVRKRSSNMEKEEMEN